MKNVLVVLIIAFGVFVSSSCKKSNTNTTPNPVPYEPISLTMNLNNPLYSPLLNQGGYVYVDNYGYKGLVIVHDYADQYWAMDRSCPYHVTSTCGKVVMQKAGLGIACGSYGANNVFKACCSSTYSLDGNILTGPTTFPLRRYSVAINGEILTVTN